MNQCISFFFLMATAAYANAGNDAPATSPKMDASNVEMTRPLGTAERVALPPLKFIQTIWNKADFGRAGYYDGEFRVRRLDDGFLETIQSGSYRASPSPHTETIQSLCGLAPRSRNESSDLHLTSSPTIGGASFTMQQRIVISVEERATRLEPRDFMFCGIQPDSTFDFLTETESIRRSQATYLGSSKKPKIKTTTITITHRCKAAGTSTAASLIAGNLSGNSIDVTCESVDQKKRITTSRYAYLVDYRYYLPLSEQSKWQRHETTYFALDE